MAVKTHMNYNAPFVGSAGVASLNPVQLVNNSFRTLLKTLQVWQARVEERRHLAEMDGHLLADLGLSRDQLTQESEKPFWRA